MDDQLENEAIGAALYDRGYGLDWCENSDQVWGWRLAREECEGIPAQ